MKLAISGKGGVGKTTVAAALIRFFASRGYRVYAVDADPDISLGTVLGLPEEQIGALKPVVDMREAIAERAGGNGAFFSLNPEVDDLLADYTMAYGNILFLKMGAVKHGGSTCYCRENAVLNALVNSLLLKREEIVVLDMSAGIEHLTRGTARGVDVMLIVTEPSLVSVRTARVVQNLAKELGVAHIKFIANKVRNSLEREFLQQHFKEEEILGIIPFDEDILNLGLGLEGKEPLGLKKSIESMGHLLLTIK